MAGFRWIQAISLLIGPGLGLLLRFDVINWTADQLTDVVTFSGLVVAGIAQGLGIRAESTVTPTLSPRTDDGVPLVPANIEPIV